MKNNEITDLTNKINNLNNCFNSKENVKDELQNNLLELNSIKENQRDKISEIGISSIYNIYFLYINYYLIK